MSEQGWRDFLAAEGVDDWVVLHSGAAAVFGVGSLSEAAQLAEALTKAPGIAGAGILITLADTHVSVRLNRDIWSLESQHVQLAQAISSIAREHGAVPNRKAVQEVQIAIAAKRDEIDIGFWRAVLGYVPMADDNAIDPLGHGSTVWMQQLDQAKPLRHAMHIDVSVAREHVKARLETAIAAGGRIADESHAPSHWTLADRAGNRVCICAWPDGSTQIRPALPADARAIADVHVRTWQAAYRGVVPDEYLESLSIDQREAALREALSRGLPEIWVADSESKIIGWVAFGASRDSDAAPTVGEIEAIYVCASHWSQRTGWKLWTTARARLVERQFTSVTLWVLEDNHRAIQFYRKVGFVPDITSRKQITIGGKSLWEVRYACALNE